MLGGSASVSESLKSHSPFSSFETGDKDEDKLLQHSLALAARCSESFVAGFDSYGLGEAFSELLDVLDTRSQPLNCAVSVSSFQLVILRAR